MRLQLEKNNLALVNDKGHALKVNIKEKKVVIDFFDDFENFLEGLTGVEKQLGIETLDELNVWVKTLIIYERNRPPWQRLPI